MRVRPLLRLGLKRTPLAALSLLTFVAASAQQFKNPDNLGPDIPTPQSVVEEMLKDARIKPGDTVYDLGCGDGRILIMAAQKFNAKAVGIEMSRDIFDKTTEHIRQLGLSDRIKVLHGNALHADLSGADVVTLYLLTSSNERLKPALASLHPGARVVSHDFEIRGWKPERVSHVNVNGTDHTVYVYEIRPKS